MASQTSVSSRSGKLFAIFLCLVVCVPQIEARTCVFRCMREVFSCKRTAALEAGDNGKCCELYYQCFRACKPDAVKLPPCQTGVGKRDGWEKQDYLKAAQDIPHSARYDFFLPNMERK